MATSTSTSPTSTEPDGAGARPPRRGDEAKVQRATAGRGGPAALSVLVLALAVLPVLAAAPGSALVPATAGGSPGWLLGPLRTVGLGATPGQAVGPPVLAALVVAVAAYAVAVVRAREIPPGAAVAAVGALYLLFLLAPPLLSQDVFSYLAYARMGAVHGLDPYLAAPAAIPGDPVHAFAGSRWSPSVYAPPFTLATYALAGATLPVGLWVLKAAVSASSLAAVALVWRAARRRGGDPRGPALLVGLNPAVVVHVVGGAHNEALVLLAGAGALLAYVSGHAVRGTALAAAATGVKASAGVLVPFLVAGARGRRPGAAALAGGSVAALGLAVGTAGFGAEGVAWFDVIRANQARTSSFSLPHKTAELLGVLLPGDRLSFKDPVRLAYGIAFAAVAPWLLWRTWRGADPIAMAGWATLALLLCSAWLVPWYLAWLLPLAALGGSRRLAVGAVALTAWTLPVALPL